MVLGEAVTFIKPLFLFILGIVIYSIAIFKFYRFLSRRDIFPLNLKKYNKVKHPHVQKTMAILFYLLEYIVIFPVIIFFAFGVLTILFSFIAQGNVAIENTLIVAIAVVGAVRVTAYYDELLAQDIAKLLPFAVLGTQLVNVGNFDFSKLNVVMEISFPWTTLLYYLIFIVLLEFIMRVGEIILVEILGWGKNTEEEKN